MNAELFIGLMSGTSVDAIDAVIVDLSATPQVIATHSHDIPPSLKKDIFALTQPGENAIIRMGQADVALGNLFSQACLELLNKANLSASDICAIGSHGQTIRHHPNDTLAFTTQIGDPNIIAAQTGITTVADFRRRDIALGGQGAPLAPTFHEFLLRSEAENRWVLNIGGIANLTLLPMDSHKNIIGFDTGPGNTLMDAWYRKHNDGQFDCDGAWAASGVIHSKLLEKCLADDYFYKAPPKSTGPDYFNLDWLASKIGSDSITPADVQATLCALTVHSISQCMQQASHSRNSIWVCGGGANNTFLMEQLSELNNGCDIQSTEVINIHPDWIEACAFAWFAKQTLERKPSNLPSVTGAEKTAVLGGVYYS